MAGPGGPLPLHPQFNPSQTPSRKDPTCSNPPIPSQFPTNPFHSHSPFPSQIPGNPIDSDPPIPRDPIVVQGRHPYDPCSGIRSSSSTSSTLGATASPTALSLTSPTSIPSFMTLSSSSTTFSSTSRHGDGTWMEDEGI
jgi:hypothetical protein